MSSRPKHSYAMDLSVCHSIGYNNLQRDQNKTYGVVFHGLSQIKIRNLPLSFR